MAASREFRATDLGGYWRYTNDTLTGNLAATDIDNGDTIPTGLYRYSYMVRSNGAVASSTVIVKIAGVSLSTALDLNVAADVMYGGSGLMNIGTAGPQVSTTTASSPTYDIAVIIERMGDVFS